MFIAAYFYYKQNQEVVDSSVVAGKDKAVRVIAKARSEIQEKSSKVLYQAARCYSTESVDEAESLEMKNSADDIYHSFFPCSETWLPESIDTRKEWIDATFGEDLFVSKNIPRYDENETRHTPLIVINSTFLAKSSEDLNKNRMILSSIAMGVYIREIKQGTEASYAGIKVGSVLVGINGINVLGEPSHKAFEILRQHNAINPDDKSSCKRSKSSNHMARDSIVCSIPLEMSLYKSGTIYSVLLFSTGQYGISWAACGNFAFVPNSSILTKLTSIKGGCLLAALNENTIRNMDEKMAVSQIRDHFIREDELSMYFAFTPGLARLMTHEDIMQCRNDPELSLGSVYHSLISDEEQSEMLPKVSMKQFFVAEAEASPETLQGRWMKWNSIDAVIFCLQMFNSDYDEDRILTEMTRCEGMTRANIFQSLLQQDNGSHFAESFLPQCVSLLHELSSDDSLTLEVEVETINEVCKLLLDMALHDHEFRQELHYMLLSFLHALDGHFSDGVSSSCFERKSPLVSPRSASDPSAMKSEDVIESNQKRSKALEKLFLDSCKITLGIIPDATMSSTPNSDLDHSHDIVGSFQLHPRLLSSNKGPIVPSNSEYACETLKSSAFWEVSRPSTSLGIDNYHSSFPALLQNMQRFLLDLSEICESLNCNQMQCLNQGSKVASQSGMIDQGFDFSKLTTQLRKDLHTNFSSLSSCFPIMNPMNANEMLSSIDIGACSVLNLRRFPLLITFNMEKRQDNRKRRPNIPSVKISCGNEQRYLTTLKVVSIRDTPSTDLTGSGDNNDLNNHDDYSYLVRATVGGCEMATGKSTSENDAASLHYWEKQDRIIFENLSASGPPQTLYLVVYKESNEKSSQQNDIADRHVSRTKIGHYWIDLQPLWEKTLQDGFSPLSPIPYSCHLCSLETSNTFDQYGNHSNGITRLLPMQVEIELQLACFDHHISLDSRKAPFQRMLVYNYKDDFRQEMFANQFINVCASLLKASGLDLKLLTLKCISVGVNQGFFEWMNGCAFLSEICGPSMPSFFSKARNYGDYEDERPALSNLHFSDLGKAKLWKHLSGAVCNPIPLSCIDFKNEHSKSPIQDFLRKSSFDADAPFFIRKAVMDNYIKSCAGYFVLTYLLGVADRNLDTLLLHQNGYFLQYSYSKILSCEVQSVFPLEIRDHLIGGMGGRHSNNYARFLSLASAVFVALRRHVNVRIILSMIRSMVPAALPSISNLQDPSEALEGVRLRMKLELSPEEAITFMEELIEESLM